MSVQTDHVKSQNCHTCYGELDLIVESKEVFKAKIIDQIPNEDVPSFNLEMENDNSVVEYDVYFFCPKCKFRCYDANKNLAYDDTFDVLIFPEFDPDSKYGHRGFVPMSQHQPPFAPNVSIPPVTPPVEKKEEKLPTIVKPSTGGVIEEVAVPDPMMEGYGWD